MRTHPKTAAAGTQRLARLRFKTVPRPRRSTPQLSPPPSPPRAPLLVGRFAGPLVTPELPATLASYNPLRDMAIEAAKIARSQMKACTATNLPSSQRAALAATPDLPSPFASAMAGGGMRR